MEIPEVYKQKDGTNEEFKDYIKRWPLELTNFPKCLVKHWVYPNWLDFIEWIPLNILSWKYEKSKLTNDEIIGRVRPFTKTIGILDFWGQQLFSNSFRQKKSLLAEYMLENGTTPSPILVLKNNGKIIHPDSTSKNQEIFDPQILQLIEGHMRTSYLRGMINKNYDKLKPEHEVWIASV
jgi:hypothetical protein